MSFADLDQNQQANLLYFLDKSDHHELNKLKHKYGVRQGRNAKEFRQNALNNLMTGCIPFDDFMSWLSHIYLEGNNMLFVYEPRNIDLFETNPINKVFNDTKDKIEHLYNINVKTLKEVTLVNVQMDLAKSQLIFTFVSPSQVLVKNDETNSWESQDDIYMSYVIMDYKLKHFVLVMHPTEHLVSVCGIKKKEWDELTWILMKRFRETVIKFDFSNPEWIIDTLFKLTEEYFYHNNPVVDEKLRNFEHTVMPKLIKSMVDSDIAFKRKGYPARFKKALLKTYENELIIAYGRIEKPQPFEIFLHKSDKGSTEFKANSRGNAFSYAECAEIIRLMWENGEIAALGIIHKLDDNGVIRKYPYVISKKDKYYSLKRTTTATTVKEVMDNVLRKLNSYKQEVQPSFTGVAESE